MEYGRWSREDGGVRREEATLNKEWWNRGANAMLVGLTIWHPFFDLTGNFCRCGIDKDTWHMHNASFVNVLAFARVLVEDVSDGWMKQVPAGNTRAGCERMFCEANPAARQAYSKSPEDWHRDARQRFLAKALICVHSVPKSVDVTSVMCANLSGECVASFDVHPSQDTLAVLKQMILDHAPLPSGASAWELVVPDGTCCDEQSDDKLLEELLQ